MGQTTEDLLEKVKSIDIEYSNIEIIYQVMNKEMVENMKIWIEALKRQYEIWLFDCQVEAIEMEG